MRTGMTLPEAVLALVVVGLVGTIAFPKLRHTLDQVVVDRTAYALVAAHHRARVLAVTESRPTWLRFTRDSLVIRIHRKTGPVRGWSAPGPGRHRVALSGPTKWLIFSPTGLTMGFSNGRWVLRRGQAYRAVVLSRLGRARFLR